MERRVYYDHEPVYRKIAASGGLGWDDGFIDKPQDSYLGLIHFSNSPLCPDPESSLALDLGCGGGQASIMLAQRGFRVMGVDYSETAISLAVANAAQAKAEIAFHVGDCTKLDFLEKESFHLIIDNHVSHCLIVGADRAAFFSEVRRLLTANGAFFSETMFACEHLDQAAVEMVPGTNHNANHTRCWVTHRKFTDELHSAGLDILSMEERHQPSLKVGCFLTTVAY